MKELDEIDHLFQSAFEGFETTPDPVVKEHIDRALASQKKHRRFFLILFPVLFISAAFTAMLYFRPLSGNKFRGTFAAHETNQPKEVETTTVFRSDLQEKTTTNSDHYFEHEIPEKDERKNVPVSRKNDEFPGKSHSRLITDYTINTTNTSLQQQDDNRRKNALLHPNNSDTHTFSEENLSGSIAANTSESQPKQQEPRNDSTTLAITDSIENPESAVAEIAEQPLPASNKMRKWSLTVLGGWEAEQKKPTDHFDITDFSTKRKEFARIHSSSFYAKIELNRILTSRLNLVTGLGFRTSRLTQYGSLYQKDSMIVVDGATSSPPPDSVVHFFRHQTGTQIYQVNAVTLPIGLSYLVPITSKFQLRFSGGIELTYGWLTKKQLQGDFSVPQFQAFGCNLWLRPELHYDFGKLRIIGFGSLNQALSQQLKWDFSVRRNPAFGAGIGLSFRL